MEGLLACRAGPERGDERLFSYGAEGVVRLWELDAEQACDVYRLVVGGVLMFNCRVLRGRCSCGLAW